MFRLVNFCRSFEKLRPVGRMRLIENFFQTFSKASSVKNGDKETIKPYVSVTLSSPDTLHNLDYEAVCEGLTSSKYFHIKGKNVSNREKQFKTLVDLAFKTLLYPFRSQSEPETVLLLYIGHGHNITTPDETKELTFSSPKLDDVGISKNDLERGKGYITPERLVKGGEFSLSERFGFCDLGGILELWITALTRSSRMKNKHLIVIADNCYSGMFVEDLQQLALKKGPWNRNGCTVTVQSACSSDEVTFVEYFASCFVHFNTPKNHGELDNLKQKWNSKSELEKIRYRNLNLPSPQVATTMSSDKLSSNLQDPTTKFLPDKGFFPLTLFHDAGFFKYCFLFFSGLKVRAEITPEEAEQLLFKIVDSAKSRLCKIVDKFKQSKSEIRDEAKHSKFEIVDFKLKTATPDGTLLALFLFKHPDVEDCFVRVCFHFSERRKPSPDLVIKVNLTGLSVTKVNLTFFSLSENLKILNEVLLEYNKLAPKTEVPIGSKTKRLAKLCQDHVNKEIKEDRGKLSDVISWSMTESFKRKKLVESTMKV